MSNAGSQQSLTTSAQCPNLSATLHVLYIDKKCNNSEMYIITKAKQQPTRWLTTASPRTHHWLTDYTFNYYSQSTSLQISHNTTLWHWSVARILSRWVTQACYSKYADDLTAVIPSSISDLAVGEFGHIQHWSSANRLHINLSKLEMISLLVSFALEVWPSSVLGYTARNYRHWTKSIQPNS